MVEVTQGVQKRWFKYDSLGRLLRVRQPEQEVNTALNLSDPFNTTGQWTAGFTYDVLGNVVRATDANGVNIVNEYDRANRVTKRCYTKPNINSTATNCAQISSGDQSTDTPTVTFWYDGKGLAAQQTPNYAKGKLTKVTSSVSETQNTLFDNFGRITESRQITDGQTFTSKYTYNLAGALIEEEYPSGRKVKNEFEPDGDLARVTSARGASVPFVPYVSGFSYTASGGISQMKLGNNKWETAKFNNRLQVIELDLGSSATDAGMWKVNYDYGELAQNGVDVEAAKNTGNIAMQTLSFNGLSNPFIQAYRYDSLYRLKEAKETPSGSSTPNWTQNWTYDPYGNRLTFTQNIAGNTTALNPAVSANSNRFTSSDFTYDKNGNVIRDKDPATNHIRDFIFNGDNKQIEIKDYSAGNQTVAKYFYDGEGKRIKKYVEATGETTVFVYSSGKLVAEYSTAAPPAEPKINYTTTDHLGSPRVITNAIGQVTSRRDFLPFGEELTINVGARTETLNYGSLDNIRQKFTGYQKDTETSLDFAEARMYENRFGRFTAVDPLLASGKSAKPQSFNRYAYVVNNPLSMTDPSGQCPVGECPTSYYGTVYYKDIDGKRWYNNENDGSWEIYKGDTLFWRNDNKGYARVNEFGWYTMNTSQALAYLGEQGNSYTATFAGFGRDLNLSDQFRLTFTAMGKSGGNVLVDFDNLFYRTAEKLSLFVPEKLPTVERWEPVNAFEAQQMRSTDIALMGVSIYSGGLATSARAGSLGARTAASFEGTGLPLQTHHFATIRNKTYTPQMSKIANEFGLSLKGSWNTQPLPHLGRHPNAYHDFVLRGMQNARAGANGNQADFLRLFDLNVRQPVIKNPQLLRKSGW